MTHHGIDLGTGGGCSQLLGDLNGDVCCSGALISSPASWQFGHRPRAEEFNPRTSVIWDCREVGKAGYLLSPAECPSFSLTFLTCPLPENLLSLGPVIETPWKRGLPLSRMNTVISSKVKIKHFMLELTLHFLGDLEQVTEPLDDLDSLMESSDDSMFPPAKSSQHLSEYIGLGCLRGSVAWEVCP